MAKMFPKNSVIPSQALNQKWIWAEPSLKTLSGDLDSMKIGKWMLFLNRKNKDNKGFTKLDKAWLLLVHLVEENILIDAKCSMAVGEDPDNGVIICYTDDYTNKAAVKHTAEAIRRAIHYPKTLYYTTDKSARSYRRFVDKAATVYQYTIRHEFFERNEKSEWKLIENVNETVPKSLS